MSYNGGGPSEQENPDSNGSEVINFRIPRRYLRMVDDEARSKGVSRSDILREIVGVSLDPQGRKGVSYGAYLRHRDAQAIRAMLSLVVIGITTLGSWTIGFLAI